MRSLVDFETYRITGSSSETAKIIARFHCFVKILREKVIKKGLDVSTESVELVRGIFYHPLLDLLFRLLLPP